MPANKVNLREKFTRFTEQWSPKIVADVNDYHVKLAKVQGEFVWHRHEDTDELFLVVRGQMTIKLRDGYVTLEEGDLYVVPRGVEHKPVAEQEAHILLLEPAGTVNTGDAGGERTVQAERI
jgi:mannose-6-phosphate isomerase-like protein (cupin superfamily)